MIRFDTSYAIIISLFLMVFQVRGQEPAMDRIHAAFQLQDSLDMDYPDSLKEEQSIERSFILSPNAIENNIKRNARDSSYFDIKNKKLHLYGNAHVEMEGMKVTSGYIILDKEKNVIESRGYIDSSGSISAFPLVQMGNEQFNAKLIKYNYKTKKGYIEDSYRNESDLYIRGEEAKLITKEENDTTVEMTTYMADATISTCDHPVPHFAIKASKQKLVLNKVAVVGPSNLQFNGVPSPIVLPFGFFPITTGRSSGLIFPRSYENSNTLGFGLSNVGWYFPINDYMDLQLTGDIYLRGSFRVNALTRYIKRYKYSGEANISFASIRQEIVENNRPIVIPNNSFSIRLAHRQDKNAHPTINFGGTVNVETNGFRKTNLYDPQSQVENTLSSNLSFSKMFPENNLTLTTAMSHSQNTSTHLFTATFPSVSLKMNQQIYPFKRDISGSKQKWYEKITFRYGADFVNRVHTTDTTLFTKETLENAQFGLSQKASTDMNFNILKYINVTPSASYTEEWAWRTTEKELADEYEIVTDTTFFQGEDYTVEVDTTKYGIVKERQVWGFEPIHKFNANVSLGTSIFGTIRFKKGYLRGLRHTMKPRISFGYVPNYSRDKYGYFKYHDSDLRSSENDPVRYSIFENSLYNVPGSRNGYQMNFNIANVLEAKVFQSRDSTEKNITLLPTLTFSGSYNFEADSMKLSNISFGTNVSLFDRHTSVSLNGSFNPYGQDEEGSFINEYLVNKTGKLAKLEFATLTASTRITVDEIVGLFSHNKDSGKKKKRSSKNDNTIWGALGNFTFNHNIQLQYRLKPEGDTLYIGSHEINTFGRIPLTKNWSVNITRIGYSFTYKKITYPSIGIERDLHCWSMGIDWQPSLGRYSFYLKADPGTFDFLEVPYKQNQFDGESFF